MAAPLKPWERPGVSFQNSVPLPSNSMSGTIGSSPIQMAATGVPSASSLSNTSDPPRIPPRPSQQTTPFNNRFGSGLGYGGYGGYSNYGGYSSPMGFGGYGGYNSPYSSYGSYGMNRIGDTSSAFARHAEESSRPAFESIESIVSAVNSVGMMLDSTFQAVYNSFRAVIGVADNFSRLKTQLVQVFSALAFIRTLRYVFRKLLELIRLRPQGEADKQWKQAFQEAAAAAAVAGAPDGGPKRSTWPILMFFGIVLGGPYLIWKLISAFSGTSDEKGWMKQEDDHFVAKASYSFQGQGIEELSFSAGQTIIIAPKELQPRVRGWLMASVDGQKTGMIPANYVRILGKQRGSKNTSAAHPPSIKQNDGDIFPSQESQLLSSSKGVATVPENELESAFEPSTSSRNGIEDPVSSQNYEHAFDVAQDTSDQDAADILSNVKE